MKQTTCLFILAIAVILGAAHASGVVRGVKPSAQHLYKGTHIECDGGKKVPIGRVNDDFCDCADGADEPGTSACSNGKFFCINEGFRGLSIPSSWLADGHCDCCDGSDEAAGKCANTCKEQAKAHESSVASEIGLQERGLRQREAYIAHARTERDRHAKLITEAEKKLATLETKVAELERVKVAAEDAYSAAFDEAEAKINAEHEEKEAKQAEAEKELPEGADNLATHQKEQRPNPDEDPIVAPLKDVKEKATNDWSEAKNERDAASRELEGFRKFMNLDFGSDLAYHGLYGTTYEFIDKEYTYKLNAFTDVQQTKPGHSSNLGRWKNWDENKSNVMIYDSGDRCWGAPDRSTRVTLICGDENKIIDVQEPNKCEYAIKMRTPAACSKADLDALRHGE